MTVTPSRGGTTRGLRTLRRADTTGTERHFLPLSAPVQQSFSGTLLLHQTHHIEPRQRPACQGTLHCPRCDMLPWQAELPCWYIAVCLSGKATSAVAPCVKQKAKPLTKPSCDISADSSWYNSDALGECPPSRSADHIEGGATSQGKPHRSARCTQYRCDQSRPRSHPR